eukprot:12883273-Prorocentrum_lima.AAC.1
MADGALEYCGAAVNRKGLKDITVPFRDYVAKVKPINIAPKAADDRMASAGEIRQLRGLRGSLQWPATQ